MSQFMENRHSDKGDLYTNNNVCSINRSPIKNCFKRVNKIFANKHIKLTKKHINSQLAPNREFMLVEFGIKLTILTKGIYIRLFERGLEAYLLIIPSILLFWAL